MKPWDYAAMAQTAEQRREFVEDGDPNFRGPHYEKIVLALDISTKTGWAVWGQKLDGTKRLIKYGVITEPKGQVSKNIYPWSFIDRVCAYRELVMEVVREAGPEVVVIEETNQGKNRYTQKLLEWIHLMVCVALSHRFQATGHPAPQNVIYISTGAWKSALGLKMDKSQSKNNRVLKQIKDSTTDPAKIRELKKQFGVAGKVTGKHLSVNYVNETEKLGLKQGQNDIADAVCLGKAYLSGAQTCNGK